MDPPTNDATVWPALTISSSVIGARVGAMATSTGASLTAVTAIEAVSVALLNAVDPPWTLASMSAPALPIVRSHAR